MVALEIEDRPKRAQRLPAEERRQQILDAAIAVFALRGFTAAGTAEIAAAAGIGEPTIYRYFPNKLELYTATIRYSADVIMEAWRRIAEENEDPLNALLMLGQWYHQSMLQRPEILRLRFRSIMDAGELGLLDWARETQEEFRSFVRGLFVRAKENGRLNPTTDPETMTLLFMAVGALMDQMNLLGNSDEIQPRDLVALGNVLFEGRL
jgi:AcrR family transcriptional regulator